MAKIPDEQRSVALDLVYDRRRDGLRPAEPVHGAVRGRHRVLGAGPGGPRSWPRCRCSSGWSGASSTASATAWRPTSTRRWSPGPPLEIINDTLLSGHEDRRRAVRLRPDAAAVRAGQSAEVMKTAVAHLEPHMERTDDDGKGTHRAGHRQGRRARHRQEPGRHHPDQQRLQRGQPGHQAADLDDPGRRRGAPRRRRRHVRAAGQVHGDHEGEPAGDELPRGGRRAARCCSAVPRSPAPTWRTTSPRSTRAASPTPATRSRACG